MLCSLGYLQVDGVFVPLALIAHFPNTGAEKRDALPAAAKARGRAGGVGDEAAHLTPRKISATAYEAESNAPCANPLTTLSRRRRAAGVFTPADAPIASVSCACPRQHS